MDIRWANALPGIALTKEKYASKSSFIWAGGTMLNYSADFSNEALRIYGVAMLASWQTSTTALEYAWH